MSKGTKAFRIIITVLLTLTMLCSAFFAAFFCLYFAKDPFGLYIAGISVDRNNNEDILGDGTVYYDYNNNLLVLNNATIESEDTVVYSKIDLHIQLIGENKIICTNEEYAVGVYAGDSRLNKDLALLGDGSLTIEIPNATEDAAGLSAADLIVEADVTVTTPDCQNAAFGIVCDSSLIITSNGTVTVNNGAAKNSVAVRVRGNALMEAGSALNVSADSVSNGISKGLNVSGDLFLGKSASLAVSVDDEAADYSECIRVSGLMELETGVIVNASAKNAYAIECFGAINANEGAVISAASDKNDVDIFCSGTVINHGAEITGKIDAIGEVRNQE